MSAEYIAELAQVFRTASQNINAKSPSYISRILTMIDDAIYQVEGLPGDEEGHDADAIAHLRDARASLEGWRAPQ